MSQDLFSFPMGEDTLMAIEREDNLQSNKCRTPNSKENNDDQCNSSLDVIEESPTNEVRNYSKHKSVCERLKAAATQKKLKRKLIQKTKSDSILSSSDKKSLENEQPSKMSLTQMIMHDDIHIDISAWELSCAKLISPAVPNSNVRLLQNKDSPIPTKPLNNFTDYDNLHFDCSMTDDNLLESQQKTKDKSSLVVQEDQNDESLLDGQFTETILDQAITDGSLDLTATETDKTINDLINPRNEETTCDLDNVSFIQYPNDHSENSRFIEDEMRLQKSILQESRHLHENDIEENIMIYSESMKVVKDCENKSLLMDNTKNLLFLSNWNLPKTIVNEYRKKNVEEMFEWQMSCLKNPKVLFENANLVYSAPTSAGKTLVSEILMIKNIIERKKKSIFILPFVSVVREKMFYLQDLLESSGIRVEGFYGGYHPAGGFESIDLAICTIEKANAIVNKLLEQEKLSDVGVIVIDEIHMISDPQRGYILELLLSKILFICEKFNLKIQLVTMSATLPNVELLRYWLKAEYFHTDFRPIELKEMIKFERNIYDNEMKPIRVLNGAFERYFENDSNQIGQLCMETLIENCQLIVFCPSKEWCEALCKNLAAGIVVLQDEGCDLLKKDRLGDLLSQFKGLPSGMDKSLEITLPSGCAFHHAGLSTEERDLIEMGFKEGLIRILIATSTLSSGVNLPARRVIIRTPMFAGKMMSNLTYRQMIGRAGRKGKDVLGESILICDKTNFQTGKKLMTAALDPIKSCLNADGNAHLKRAILEIIASGTASTTLEIERFVQLTLYHQQEPINFSYFTENETMLKQKYRENLTKGKSEQRIPLASSENENDPITSCMLFLLEFEFIRLHIDETTDELKFIATRLGLACLSSSMAPKDGFLLFTELNKARQNFSLASDLHAIYLVTPYSVCYSLQHIDWMHFFDIWDKLPPQMQKVGELVGIKDSFFIKAVKSEVKVDYKSLQIHKR